MAEASRRSDLQPTEIEGWVDDGKRGMERNSVLHLFFKICPLCKLKPENIHQCS